MFGPFPCGRRSESVDALYYLACLSLLIVRNSMPLVVAGAGRLRFLGCLLLSLVTLPTLPQLDPQTKQLSRDIFQQLIEINTTDSVGSTTVAANAMAKRLLDAGFPKADVVVLGPDDRKGNHGGAHSWHRRCEAHPLYRPPRCGGSPALRLDHRPVQVCREGWLLLRSRHPGYEGERRRPGDHLHLAQKIRIQAGPRPDPGSYRRRGGRQIEWC